MEGKEKRGKPNVHPQKGCECCVCFLLLLVLAAENCIISWPSMQASNRAAKAMGPASYGGDKIHTQRGMVATGYSFIYTEHVLPPAVYIYMFGWTQSHSQVHSRAQQHQQQQQQQHPCPQRLHRCIKQDGGCVCCIHIIVPDPSFYPRCGFGIV